MSEGSSFNSGLIGANFNWWIGQIVDDNYWKDNISASNFDKPSNISGWGRRYKVRIIGRHDKEEEVVPSDQLPWANVVYPVTAGGGQAACSATTNLRKGNFVFGFFLDNEEQIPMIFGVLGNNAQTVLARQVGITSTNYGPISGFAQSATGNPDLTLRVPDEAISTTGTPNTTIEQPDNPHQQSLAKLKRQELYDEKISLMNPCDMVGSALRVIQEKLDWLVKKINKYLNQAQSYIDTAVGYIQEIKSIISNISCIIAKYVKIVFDKIMEYMMKTINSAIAPTIESIPPNKRQWMLLIKDSITELINCLYNKIINSLCGQIENYLNQKLNTETLPETPSTNTSTYTQYVSPCAVEDLVAGMIYTNMPEIDQTNETIISTVNEFLNDISSELSAASGILSTVSSTVNGINSSILTALNFENIKINVFGCDLKPKCPTTESYSLQEGGFINLTGATLIGLQASMQTQTESYSTLNPIPYVEPPK